MDLSELPPFEKLVKNYDIGFCKEMIGSIETDLDNLNKKSVKMIELSAKSRGITSDQYLIDQKAALNGRIQLLNDRINELS